MTMGFRPNSAVPAFVLLGLAALLLWLSLNLVDEGNAEVAVHGSDDVLEWGGLTFVLSLVAGAAALAAWFLQRPRQHPAFPAGGALAGPIALADAARSFVLRLHTVMVATGVLVLIGGLGLVAAASLTSDGTPVSPLGVPGVWQVQVTSWALMLLAIGVMFWAREYRWTLRLRRAWTEAAPEV